jgi:predicted deacylase
MAQMIRAGKAWGAPYLFLYRDVAGGGLLPSYAESLGKVTLGTEMGSASQFTPEILRITERGVYNVLASHGIVDASLRTLAAAPCQVVASDEQDDYMMAPMSGIYEPFLEIGDPVAVGQALGQIHTASHPTWEPMPVLARTGGLLMGRRSFPLTQHGECVAVIARHVDA